MTSKDLSVLISGGLGQLGYYTYLQLRDKYSIVIVDNQTNSKVSPPNDVEFYDIDIAELDNTDIPPVDYVVHCAAQISVSKSTQEPLFDAQTNIIGTLHILEYCRKSNVKKIIYISSAATYGSPHFLPITEEHPRNPLSPYGYSKFVAENYVLTYEKLFGIKSTVLVPFNIYSPLQNEDDPYSGVIHKFITAIKNDLPIYIEGDGNQTRDFIHAKDVSLAIELALVNDHSSGEVINIGSGTPTTINTLSKTLISVSGKNNPIKHIDPRVGDIRESYCSIEKAKKVLRFEPTISLRNGLDEMFNFLDTNK